MKVFFTICGQEVACVPLPRPLCDEIKRNKGLFPSICLGSSADDKVQVTFNPALFDFNIEDKINVSLSTLTIFV